MKSDIAIQEPRFISVPEAAKLCGVSRNTLYTWVRKGKLSAYQTPGRTNLIRPSDLVAFMQQSGLFVPAELADMARNDEVPETLNNGAESSDTERIAVLVVDDEAASRSVHVRAMNGQFRVFQAQTGFEALHLLTVRSEIQIVLLDLRMPGQHGLTTLKEIAKLRPDIRVLIITGFAAELPESVRRNSQVVAVLEKPVPMQKLQSMIEQLAREVDDAR